VGATVGDACSEGLGFGRRGRRFLVAAVLGSSDWVSEGPPRRSSEGRGPAMWGRGAMAVMAGSSRTGRRGEGRQCHGVRVSWSGGGRRSNLKPIKISGSTDCVVCVKSALNLRHRTEIQRERRCDRLRFIRSKLIISRDIYCGGGC
jgi:hypothetical protein